MRWLLIAIVSLLPGLAHSQTYPAHQSPFVNDFAGLIDDTAEASLVERLSKLRDDTGVEMTVLTLNSWKTFGGHDTIESFATGLFNDWGIGDASRNDGVLILIAQDDREMRIELGQGYLESYDIIAGDVIDQVFVPAFRAADYSNGIIDGAEATIVQIADRNAAGLKPAARQTDGKPKGLFGGFLIPILIAAGAALMIFRRRISDIFLRARSCPTCGRRGLHRHREVLTSATKDITGMRRETMTCDHCDYHHDKDIVIPRQTRSSGSGSFGGGRSSGGGASGKW